MTSPDAHGAHSAPNPAMLAKLAQADDGQDAVDAIQTAVAALDAVREQPVSEHVEAFEAVHSALTGALAKADNLLSGTNAHGS
ncbi:hypothetical protein GCM10025787_59010 [Saccharopolyspora rosea]|uniref:Uncharacterized protein n=1 Tax=Saccharopolyspora rosea TaxID=524884 RepID=A0ABW3FXR4_9PSEU